MVREASCTFPRETSAFKRYNRRPLARPHCSAFRMRTKPYIEAARLVARLISERQSLRLRPRVRSPFPSGEDSSLPLDELLIMASQAWPLRTKREMRLAQGLLELRNVIFNTICQCQEENGLAQNLLGGAGRVVTRVSRVEIYVTSAWVAFYAKRSPKCRYDAHLTLDIFTAALTQRKLPLDISSTIVQVSSLAPGV